MRTVKCLSSLASLHRRSAPFLLCSSILLTLSFFIQIWNSREHFFSPGFSPLFCTSRWTSLCPSELNAWYYLSTICSFLLSFLYVRTLGVTNSIKKKFNTKWPKKYKNSLLLNRTTFHSEKNSQRKICQWALTSELTSPLGLSPFANFLGGLSSWWQPYWPGFLAFPSQ